MGFVAVSTVETPTLSPVFEAHPGLVMRLEDVMVTDQETPEGAVQLYFWTSGGDPDAISRTIESLSHYSSAEPTTQEADGSELLRLTMTESSHDKTPYWLLSEYDIMVLDYWIEDGVGTLRARYPDRNALSAMREWFISRDLRFRLRRIYSVERVGTDEFGLTEKQREALVAAWNAGYYETPREVTLDEIAADLEITQQSLAQRLRRGLNSLLAETVADPSPAHSPPAQAESDESLPDSSGDRPDDNPL